MERNREQEFLLRRRRRHELRRRTARQARQSGTRARSLETGADVLAVGCPFCMTMMEDGINARKGERDVRVMDVSELLWEATQPRVVKDFANTPA